MLKHVVLRILINSAALWFADALLDGMSFYSNGDLIIAAVLFGLLNTFLKPVLLLLTLPINIVTLGIFTLVINGIILKITAGLMDGFVLEDFGTAFWGAIITSLVSLALNNLLEEKK